MPRPVVTMDAGRFLHVINESAQSRSAFFARVVSEMGKKEKDEWTLTALGPKGLIFEDSEHDYFTADITPKPHNKFEINNIRQIQVTESRKSEILAKACKDLVDSLCEDDAKNADVAFSKLEALRFRSRVIPESGTVVTRDGEVRHVKVTEGLFPQGIREAIVESFVAAVKDDVTVDNGRVVRGFFGNAQKFELPIDEMTRRRVVARYVKEAAQEAYKSEAFQTYTKKWAGLVCENKLTEAVQDAAKFLREYQEFCLLSLDETRDLVGKTLATQGSMNSKLAEDVGLMIYRTAIKANREDIIESWTQTAKKASDATLLERVKTLQESKNFEGDYQLMLEHVFNEEADAKTKRGQAYLNSLKIINAVIPPEGNEDLKASMSDAIAKFEKGDKVDDATLYEVEDLLASISSELIGEIERMSQFATMPGGAAPEGAAPEGGEAPGAAVDLPPMGGEGGEGDESGLEGMDLGLGAEPEEPKPKKSEKKSEGEKGEKKEKKEKPEGEKKEKKSKAEGEGEESEEEPTDEAAGEMAPIESMDETQLGEELEGWRSGHATFIIEDGVEDCMHQLGRYVKRANELKAEETAKGFFAIKSLYEDVAAEAAGDVYRLGDASPDVKIDPEYGYKGGKQPVKMERVKCPACKWWLGGESSASIKEGIVKKVEAHEAAACPKCGGKLVAEDDDVTSPEKSDYSGDIKLPHSNVGEEGKGGGKKEPKVAKEDKDITEPSKGDYGKDIQMPHGNDGHKDQGGGLADRKAKDMKPAVIGGGGITEDEINEKKKGLCPHGKPVPFCKECKGKKVAKEDKDVTEPTKGDYGKDIQMPHGNDGHKDQGGGLADRKAKEMKPANIGGGGITESQCPECEGPLVIEEVEGVQAACCGGMCDVMYEAKCPKCESVCEAGKDGKARCPKCKTDVSEDQYKWGTMRRRYGYRRSAINPLEKMSESKFNDQLDSIIEQIAGEMVVGVVEDKNVTDPSKKDFSGDVTMPHSNDGEGKGTPKVGDVMKTGQTAKGTAIGEAKPEAKGVVEDKDVTDPTKKDFGNDIKMPHGNDGHKDQGGGLADRKAKDLKPGEIGGGVATAG